MDLMRSGRKVPIIIQRPEVNDETSIYVPSVSIYATCENCFMASNSLSAYSAPFPQHHRGLGVTELLHSWYVPVESFPCGTLRRLINVLQKEGT